VSTPQADVPRKKIIVGTKVWNTNLTYKKVISSIEESLKKLGLNTINILYVRWPAGRYSPEDTFRAFAELQNQGKITHIGVSNFTIPL
jgi:2,5-diketo-D-gluconate reductase B